MLRHFRKRSGLTLIELLVTITLLSVMVAIALPIAKIAVKRQKEVELRRALRVMREAIDEYKKLADEGKIEVDEDSHGYPPDLETLVEGVEIKETVNGEERVSLVRFLRRIPKDPMTDSYDWGLRSYEDEYGSDTWGGKNIYDIYTRSWGIAIDESKYKDW